jgi:ubiquinol-cytochrome c reductase core subunit 2
MVISFPTSGYGAPDPAIAVLVALLGGESTISRSPGFSLLSKISYGNARGRVSASNLAYSDAGLLAIQLSGTAPGVRLAAEDAIKALRSISEGSISKEDLSNAIAKAKSDALDPVREVDNTLMFARPDLFRKSSLGQVKDVETLSPTPLSAEILSAGTRLLHTGATGPGQDVRKSFESVTAEKLKSVRLCVLFLWDCAAN